MGGVLDDLPQGGRVLIVRLRSLGDCVLTTPGLALLHEARPDLAVHVMVEDRFAGVFERNPAVASLLPPHRGAALRLRPHLAINLHGGSRSAALTLASLARFRAGYQHYRWNWAYNLSIPRAQEILGEERKVHTAEHVASAMFWLGVPRKEIPRASLYCDPPAQRGHAVIHPFASAPEKAWPRDRFAELARHLRADGVEPWIVGGPGDDLTPFAGFPHLAGASLAEVKRLLAGASLFVGNDSGPAHMAAAFGVPVVVLYGSSDPVIWAPWRTRGVPVVSPEGLNQVPFEAVLRAVRELRGVPA